MKKAVWLLALVLCTAFLCACNLAAEEEPAPSPVLMRQTAAHTGWRMRGAASFIFKTIPVRRFAPWMRRGRSGCLRRTAMA